MLLSKELFNAALLELNGVRNKEQEVKWLYEYACIKHKQKQNIEEYFLVLCRMRAAGMPLAYLLGSQPFLDFDLIVTPAVLIPRIETELLINIILEKTPKDKNIKILDLGTGSGVIAIALARVLSNSKITAVDNSKAALKIAAQNIAKYNLNINLVQSDWFSNIDIIEQFDIIVANPPYIAKDDPHLKQDGLNFEPQEALATIDASGLEDIKIIVKNAKKFLKPNAMLIMEHGYQQQQLVTAELSANNYKSILSFKDSENNFRVTLGIV